MYKSHNRLVAPIAQLQLQLFSLCALIIKLVCNNHNNYMVHWYILYSITNYNKHSYNTTTTTTTTSTTTKTTFLILYKLVITIKMLSKMTLITCNHETIFLQCALQHFIKKSLWIAILFEMSVKKKPFVCAVCSSRQHFLQNSINRHISPTCTTNFYVDRRYIEVFS